MEINLVVWIAMGFGLGLWPILPGTVGAILGALIAFYASQMSPVWQMLLALCLALLAVPICHYASQEFEAKDEGRIVADEYFTFPIATLGLPCEKHPALLAAAFVASRIFDHLKPPPAAQADRLSGGAGMVLDDAAANLYALGVCWLIYGGCSFRARRRRRSNSDKDSDSAT